MFSAIKRRLNFRELLRFGRSDNEDVEPCPLLDRCTLAREPDNYDRDRFSLVQYDIDIEHKFQVDAFKAALRAAPEEDDFVNFTFQRRLEHPDAEEGTLVLTDAEESDLTTLGGPDSTPSIIKTMKPVDLFSLEDIFSDVSEVIPSLLIRYTDIVGSERLAFKHDAAIYYDFCVDQIERHVSSRGVTVIPQNPSHEFFCKHAVRVFLQVPDIPDIVDGPFYRYLGDCYIVKTNQLLPEHEWNALPEYLKERFVKRFVEAHSYPLRDGFRAQNYYTMDTARELLNHGNTYPLIVLMQAWQQEETFESHSPIQLNGTDLLSSSSTSLKSVDSASVYSQESAPRDHEESVFAFYSSATSMVHPVSPLFTNPFGGNGIITFPRGQEASRAVFAYAEDESRSSTKGGDASTNSYDKNDFDNEDSDNFSGNEGEDDCQVYDNVHGGYQGTASDSEKRRLDNEQTDEDDGDRTADIQHSDELSDADRARYAALKVFCEELEETSRADTAMGRVQRQFIQNMRAEMAAMGLWDDANAADDGTGINGVS